MQPGVACGMALAVVGMQGRMNSGGTLLNIFKGLSIRLEKGKPPPHFPMQGAGTGCGSGAVVWLVTVRLRIKKKKTALAAHAIVWPHGQGGPRVLNNSLARFSWLKM